MGIELDSFRTAVKGDGQWLSVGGKDMSKVSAADLNLEQVQDPKDMNQAASNIYLRGQLLTGIRESLLSSKLMSVARDPANANKEVLLFQDKNVQKFFEDAEKQLFGAVSTKGKNKGQYGIDTAGQNLESQTVKGLIARLDALTPPAEKPQVEGKDENNINNINNINNVNNINNINNINNVNNKRDEDSIDLGGDSNPFMVPGRKNVRESELRPLNEGMSEKNPVDSDVLIESKEESGHVKEDFGLLPKNMRSKGEVVPVGAKEVEKEGTVTIRKISGERNETYEWELVNVPETLKKNREKLDAGCPFATDEQRSVLLSIGYNDRNQKLADCLGVSNPLPSNLHLADVKPMANGQDLVCTLTLGGGTGSVRVLVTPDGDFATYTDYQKCRELLPKSVDTFAAKDLHDIGHIMSFLRTEGGTDPSGEFKRFSLTLETMLPTALAKARQKVPEGDIPLSVWWNALGFKGDVPTDDPTNGRARVSVLKALQQRTRDDYNAISGHDEDYWPTGHAGYKKLISSDTYFTTLFGLKHPNLNNSPSELQAAAFFRPDRKAIADRLGISERAVPYPEFDGGEILRNDGLIECTVTRSDGKSDQILIDRDGSVVLKSTYENLHGLLGLLSVSELIDAFGKESFPAAEHFIRMIVDAAEDFNGKVDADDDKYGIGKAGRSWGAINGENTKLVTVNWLISTLPSIVKQHPCANPQDLYVDLWKGFRLPGKAPRNGDPQVGGKFLDAIRKRVCDDVIVALRVKGDDEKDIRKLLLPSTSEEYYDALKRTRNSDTTGNFGQLLSYFMRADGLSFDDKIRLHQGVFSPKLKDFPIKTMSNDVAIASSENNLLYNDAGGAAVFADDGRQFGTRFYFGDKLLRTIKKPSVKGEKDSNVEIKARDLDPKEAIRTLQNAHYSPQQIYQLGNYLNNYSMNLMCSMGLFCSQRDCNISILSGEMNNEGGDMVVQARMPVVRFHKLEKTGKPDNMLVDKTNQFIVHDFVIHKDGTMTMKDLNVTTPTHLEHNLMPESEIF